MSRQWGNGSVKSAGANACLDAEMSKREESAPRATPGLEGETSKQWENGSAKSARANACLDAEMSTREEHEQGDRVDVAEQAWASWMSWASWTLACVCALG